MLSRRSFLTLGVLAIAIAGTGAGAYASLDARGAIAKTLRRLLGDLRISDQDLGAFVTSYLELLRARGTSAAIIEIFGLLDPVLGSAWVRGLLPERVRLQIERYERHLVTNFTLSTTFFEVADPQRDEIAYLGAPGACGNPFAQFG